MTLHVKPARAAGQGLRLKEMQAAILKLKEAPPIERPVDIVLPVHDRALEDLHKIHRVWVQKRIRR